ncbi:hypothetical protein A264_26262 [Pseudomonas syringae pv. actinidiae ICMP 19071]|uniref:hypothetical protein n=1 Tax=Pseudomonas syringae TaxID=317 RepID=UPI00035739EE|nr:hypothetical protein [Pseudomonas syringae]EPM53827.1 hypothetical protein A264_26262 [Pseudomonas syringae pv. actinidiae ICMP 19071]EPM74294.1 hypothetical protein A3SO_25888 [Pseudomonas syringae pv. actinidiae ICMP 19072]OSN70013.1 hypothetical protein BV349_00282 [Pseudomonas syringae pv. actinidiae]OSN80214.1 hypothetical protein BV351_00282 [Pseudomonas syringae pv. actinidiae]RMR93384.1 hypothetical protein ALP75_205444 [Pseudomonas syringae pv. actinidiae]
MQTTQRNTRCPVYLHPAAASNRKSIAAIQRLTGPLLIVQPKSNAAKAAHAPAVDDFGPWGGDAA